jgi:hypothetical protein
MHDRHPILDPSECLQPAVSPRTMLSDGCGRLWPLYRFSIQRQGGGICSERLLLANGYVGKRCLPDTGAVMSELVSTHARTRTHTHAHTRTHTHPSLFSSRASMLFHTESPRPYPWRAPTHPHASSSKLLVIDARAAPTHPPSLPAHGSPSDAAVAEVGGCHQGGRRPPGGSARWPPSIGRSL